MTDPRHARISLVRRLAPDAEVVTPEDLAEGAMRQTVLCSI